MGIISILTGTNGGPRLRDLSLEGEGFTLDRRRDNTTIWRTDDGDLVGVYLFHKQPSLPGDDCPADDFKRQWREAAELKGAKVLNLDFCRVAAVPAIRSIVRVVSADLKTIDIGALMLPFADFFYAVKIECRDCPTIGIREALMMDPALRDDAIRSIDDTDVPDRALSRVWRWLPTIESALRLAGRVQAMPRYPLPGPTSLRNARSRAH